LYDGLNNTSILGKQGLQFHSDPVEIAKEHLTDGAVVSVRNGYPMHTANPRVNPVQIDFKAGGSRSVSRMTDGHVLHRLFENRSDRIMSLPAWLRRCVEILPSGWARRSGTGSKAARVYEAWPFAPHLLQLLEDQVLLARCARDARP